MKATLPKKEGGMSVKPIESTRAGSKAMRTRPCPGRACAQRNLVAAVSSRRPLRMVR